MKKIVLILLMCLTLGVYSQKDNNNKIIQITGAIVEGESLKPMPFVHITLKNSKIGTISDSYGFFSLVAHESDTIEFSSIGYHRNQFILPDSLAANSYSIIHAMLKDTILLKEFTIFPWPTREDFNYAFMNVDIPDDDIKRAEKNLSKENLMSAAGNVPLEGSTTYKYELQNRYTQLYLAGGFPSLKLLDPIAWSKFIKAWQNGDFKKKGNIKYLPKE